MWEEFVHHIYDIFYIFWWVLDCLKELFSIIFRPFTFLFNFGKGFFVSAFSSIEDLGIEAPPIAEIPQSVFDFFDAIPYVNWIFIGVGATIGLTMALFIFKKIIHI